jgi:hypothetical protein
MDRDADLRARICPVICASRSDFAGFPGWASRSRPSRPSAGQGRKRQLGSPKLECQARIRPQPLPEDQEPPWAFPGVRWTRRDRSLRELTTLHFSAKQSQLIILRLFDFTSAPGAPEAVWRAIFRWNQVSTSFLRRTGSAQRFEPETESFYFCILLQARNDSRRGVDSLKNSGFSPRQTQAACSGSGDGTNLSNHA